MTWQSLPTLLKEHEEYELREWTPELDAMNELMSEGERHPSGISGLSSREVEIECGCRYLATYSGRKAGYIREGVAAIAIMLKRGLR